MRRIMKFLSVIILANLIIGNMYVFTYSATELPELSLVGIKNANDIIRNIDFQDMRGINIWSKEAVYASGALGVMKGYGNRIFGRGSFLTREQALALAYNAAGREGEAQLEAEKIGALISQTTAAKTPIRYWADGYYALALKDGFINQNEYLILTGQNPANVAGLNNTPLRFLRDNPATRQEFGYYLSKLLAFQGARGQEKIFNNFNDWNQVDAAKIPYIEDLLVRGILNGDGSGNLRPNNNITREQAAAIIKNSVDYLSKSIINKRYYGTIESIVNSDDKTYPGVKLVRTMSVRNSNGNLHSIRLERVKEAFNSIVNESVGRRDVPAGNDLVVYNGTTVNNSDLLYPGDRIEYLTDVSNNIKFVKVISSKLTTKYTIAKFENISEDGKTAEILKIIDLAYPVTTLDKEVYSFNKNDLLEKYTLKNSVAVYINGIKENIDSIQSKKPYLFTIANDIITEIKNVNLSLSGSGSSIISGIVEDVNPELFYINLYNEDGKDTANTSNTRIIELSNPSNLEILKDYKVASLNDIEPGDRIFISKDNLGNVSSLSALSNYNKRLGKVIYIKSDMMSINLDDGTQKVFNLNKDIYVFEKGVSKGVESIEAGDRVMLLLSEQKDQNVLKEITIVGKEHLITDLYKGSMWLYDKENASVTLENVEILRYYGFERLDQKGFKTFKVGEDVIVYKNNKMVAPDDIGKNDRGNTVYFAVEKDYLNDERIITMTLKGKDDAEKFLGKNNILLDDVESGFISQSDTRMFLRDDTITVKKGRLVKYNNIFNDDSGIVVLNKNFENETDYASIIKIEDNIDRDLNIYRIKIKEIEEAKGFKVHSYSIWDVDNNYWNYNLAEKIFALKSFTRVLNSEGLKNNKNFVDHGENSYKDKYAYLVSDGVTAFEINEMVFSNEYIKGTIYDIMPIQNVLKNEVKLPPDNIKLKDVSQYNNQNYLWTKQLDSEISFEKNTIVIKNGKRVGLDVLNLNDKVKILKKDDKAIIIFVENG